MTQWNYHCQTTLIDMKAHEILTDESTWIQGPPAVDGAGVCCSVTDPKAKKFCLVGAIICAYPDTYAGRLSFLNGKIGVWPGAWNEAPERKFSEIRELLLKHNV